MYNTILTELKHLKEDELLNIVKEANSLIDNKDKERFDTLVQELHSLLIELNNFFPRCRVFVNSFDMEEVDLLSLNLEDEIRTVYHGRIKVD